MINELIRRCLFCKSEMKVSEEEYNQNKYCSKCFSQRLELTKKVQDTNLVERDVGDYVIFERE